MLAVRSKAVKLLYSASRLIWLPILNKSSLLSCKPEFTTTTKLVISCKQNSVQSTQAYTICQRSVEGKRWYGLLITQDRRRTSATDASVSKKTDQDGTKVRPLSNTSKSFAMGMFRGQVELEELFPFPRPLDADALEYLKLSVGPTEKFFKEVNEPAKNDKTHTFDKKTMDGLKEMGAFGLQVPVEYDGVGMNNTQYTRMVEIVGANDLAIATMLGAHQSIGFKGILLYGTDGQKKKYLADLATGKKLAAFCLTEPTSGSDANSIRSSAVLSNDQKHYVLNGSKIWISNGGLADIFTVFAKTPIKLADGSVKHKISAFVVERAFGGVTNGPPESKMGQKASNTVSVNFEDVKVPVENLLGKEGDGFKIAMNILNNGRFGIAAAMTGTMKHCIAQAVEHANNRLQFGKKIIEFASLREKIAAMAMRQYATESMAYMISGNMDKGSKEFQLEAAVSKVFSSESAWYVCDEAIQILGGMGYMEECGLERILRDLRIFRIYEGTNDILRLFVALLGIEYASGHLRSLQEAIKRPLASYGLIRDELVRRTKRMAKITVSNSLIESVHPSLSDHALELTTLVEQFGAVVEGVILKYGKEVVDKQFVLIPIADLAIELYAMAAVLSRACHTILADTATADYEKKMCSLFCKTTAHSVNNRLALLRSMKAAQDYPLVDDIVQAISANNGVVQKSPLGI